MKYDWSRLEIGEFLNRLSSGDPVPGGGGASALAGALAASLGAMAAHLTIGKKNFEIHEDTCRECAAELLRIRNRMLELAGEDAEVFENLMSAYRLPRESEEGKRIRKETIRKAEERACDPACQMILCLFELVELLERLIEICNPAMISDVGCAAAGAFSAFQGALLNIRVNHGREPERYTEYLERAKLLYQTSLNRISK